MSKKQISSLSFSKNFFSNYLFCFCRVFPIFSSIIFVTWIILNIVWSIHLYGKNIKLKILIRKHKPKSTKKIPFIFQLSPLTCYEKLCKEREKRGFDHKCHCFIPPWERGKRGDLSHKWELPLLHNPPWERGERGDLSHKWELLLLHNPPWEREKRGFDHKCHCFNPPWERGEKGGIWATSGNCHCFTTPLEKGGKRGDLNHKWELPLLHNPPWERGEKGGIWTTSRKRGDLTTNGKRENLFTKQNSFDKYREILKIFVKFESGILDSIVL